MHTVCPSISSLPRSLPWSIVEIVYNKTICELPCTLQLESSLIQASFMPFKCVQLKTLHSGSRPALSLLTVPKCTWTFNLYETFKCVQLKSLLSGHKQGSKQTKKERNIHTHVCNAVSLVSSSLRLAPNNGPF